jgi:uncharacterized protein with PIN domain
MQLFGTNALRGSSIIMPEATFRFYEELNDFLPAEKRKRDFPVWFRKHSPVKDVIQSLGVPDAEIDLILVNGASVNFSYPLRGGERVSVYPVFESLDILSISNLRPGTLRDLRFVADVNLGELAKYLRLFGFDALHDSDADPQSLVDMSVHQGRVLLTQSCNLLNHRCIMRGILVRETDPEKQLKAIFERLDLYADARPFSRCLSCNEPAQPIPKEEVARKLSPGIGANCQASNRCGSCNRLYWEGTDFQRLNRFVEDMLSR